MARTMKLTTLVSALLSVCLLLAHQSAAFRDSSRDRGPFGKSALQRRRRLGMERTEPPTSFPTSVPSPQPSASPSTFPSLMPSITSPSQVPSQPSTPSPSSRPTTVMPSKSPAPVAGPTQSPAPTLAPSAVPSRAPVTEDVTNAPTVSPSTVDLDAFAVSVTAIDLDTNALTTALSNYLLEGFSETFDTVESVDLTLNNGRRRLVVETTGVLEYSGQAVFSSPSPSASEVTASQRTLLADTEAVQEAINQDPLLGDTVVVNAIVFPDDSVADDGNNVTGLAAGVAAGGSVALILLALFAVRRRRRRRLDKDPPPPPPPLDGDEEGQVGMGDTDDNLRIVSISSKDEEEGVETEKLQTAVGVTGMIQAILDSNKKEEAGNSQALIRTVSEDDSMDGYSLSSCKPPDSAPVLRASSGDTEEKKADEEQTLTPAASEDDSMDGYSLGSSKKILAAKWMVKTADQQKKVDDYNSDSESQFTYDAIGEASVISQDALSGVAGGSSFNPYGDDEGVEVDNDMLFSTDDGSAQKSLVKGSFSNRPTPQSQKKPIHRLDDDEDDPLRTAAATSSDKAKIERSLSLPSDEAQDDEDRDLDAFAEKLEKAKAGARMSTKSTSLAGSAAKTPSKKPPTMRPPEGADDEALNDYLRDTRRTTRESRARSRGNASTDEV